MSSRRAGFLAILLCACAGCASEPPPRPFTAPLPEFRSGERFAVVGDLQRTSILELWRESNDAERAIVVSAIASVRPEFLAITGDMVFHGSAARQWAEFDALCAPIRGANIPVLAAFGNHEYWGGRAGEAHVFARFPLMQHRHWYVVSHGPLRLVFLDSNVDELSKAEWAEELLWYERTLEAIDRDPEARGALVISHHPPYTNSTVTGDEAHVQKDFVSRMVRAKKTIAMLSGHVHSYERYVREGRTFVVSGGGGGPRARLAEGDDRRHADDLYAGPPLRDFHFTLYTVTDAGVVAEVLGLPKGGRAFAPMDRFFLPWPE